MLRQIFHFPSARLGVLCKFAANRAHRFLLRARLGFRQTHCLIRCSALDCYPIFWAWKLFIHSSILSVENVSRAFFSGLPGVTSPFRVFGIAAGRESSNLTEKCSRTSKWLLAKPSSASTESGSKRGQMQSADSPISCPACRLRSVRSQSIYHKAQGARAQAYNAPAAMRSECGRRPAVTRETDSAHRRRGRSTRPPPPSKPEKAQ